MLRVLSPTRVPVMHRRLQVRQDVQRRVREREVRERLREVPELPLRLRVVLLGQQADVVRKADQAVEERMRLVVPADELVAIDEPERAGQKDALAGRQPVDSALMCPVTEDEAVLQELSLDGGDRARD